MGLWYTVHTRIPIPKVSSTSNQPLPQSRFHEYFAYLNRFTILGCIQQFFVCLLISLQNHLDLWRGVGIETDGSSEKIALGNGFLFGRGFLPVWNGGWKVKMFKNIHYVLVWGFQGQLGDRHASLLVVRVCPGMKKYLNKRKIAGFHCQ